MPLKVFLLVLLLTSPRVVPAAAPTDVADVTQGAWRVKFSPARGVTLWHGGVPVTRQSTLFLVKPGWTGVLFDQRIAPTTVTVTKTNDGQVIMTAAQSADAAVGYRITLGADESVTVETTVALTRDVPANIEYGAGYLNAALLADAPFAAETSDGPKSGVVPFTTPGTDQRANMFVPSFRALFVQTRLGALKISVSGDWPDWVCFDARRDPQSWAREAPVFWLGLGVNNYPVAFGRTYRAIVRYELRTNPPPGPLPIREGENGALPTAASPAPLNKLRSPSRFRPHSPPPVSGGGRGVGSLVLLPAARALHTASPVVIPTPKSLALTGQKLRLDTRTRLVIADDATPLDRQAALALRDELASRFGLTKLDIVREKSMTAPKNVVVFGEPGRVRWAAKLLAKAGANAPTKPEGYALRTGDGWAVVAGRDPAGTFYGAQTLCQLLGADTNGAFAWGASVDDYPSLSWRGAHLFVGNEALPFHKKLIANVFARFKLNNLVLQCEQAKWDTVGKSAPPWAMSKAHVKAEIALARAHFLTVTPLVNSVGHMEWLFRDPSRRALAEDPQTPYAANVSNPDTYAFLFRLYNEVLATFKSQSLHIGGDEVAIRGRYPFASAAKYATLAEAYAAHVTKVHDYLAAKGVRTMLWGDVLLAPGETQDAATAPSLEQARLMRQRLPKDIVLTDWHYAAVGDFSSPHLFREAGFSNVIGATWFAPGNIAAFSRALAVNRQLGLLQTTWAGYNSRAQNLADDPKQFSAFVLAAEYAWNGGRAIDPDRLPYNPARVFQMAYDPPPFDAVPRPGFALNLSAVANRPLPDTPARDGWLGYGPSHDLRALPTVPTRLADGILYQLAPRAVLLAGRLNPPGAFPASVTLPVARDVVSLHLLLAVTFAAGPKVEVGTLTVTFADGTETKTALVYGKNIAAWDDGNDAPDAPTVWTGQTTAGGGIFLRALTWKNRTPGKAIASVTVTGTDTASSIVVFGGTAVE